MPLSDHVTLTISKDTVGIARAGFGVPLILSANAAWTERVRFYSNQSGVAADFPITSSPEYLAAQAMFAQSPKPTQIAIGRASNKPTQRYVLTVANAIANENYLLNVAGQGVTGTAINFLSLSDISGTLLPRSSNTLTSTAHGMATGDGPYYVSNSGGALPTGLTANTSYWIITIDANTFQFASSLANAISLTPVSLSGDGTGTQTILRHSNDVIMAQLLQALNAVVGKNYTAVQSGSAGSQILTVTASAAANWFSIEVPRTADLGISQTHVDPGIAADLDACLNDNPGWYALCTLYNSSAYVLAAAAWVEANGKVYIPDLNESASVTVSQSSGSDCLKALQTAAYSRTMGTYHPSPVNFMAAAWLGRVLPDDPGSETWNDKTLAGVNAVPLTTTNRKNLTDRSANSYQAVFVGFNKTFRGTCADGEFFDTIRGLDFFVDDASKSIYTVIANSEKVPYEDTGIALIEGALRAAVKRSIAATIIAAGTDTYVVPLASSVSDSDRANRVLNGLQFAFRLSGAIQDVNVTGNVTA